MACYVANYSNFEVLCGKYALARNVFWSFRTKETGIYVRKRQIFYGPDKIVTFGLHRNERLSNFAS